MGIIELKEEIIKLTNLTNLYNETIIPEQEKGEIRDFRLLFLIELVEEYKEKIAKYKELIISQESIMEMEKMESEIEEDKFNNKTAE